MGSGQFAITALTPACGAEDTNFSHIYKKPNTVVSKPACKWRTWLLKLCGGQEVTVD